MLKFILYVLMMTPVLLVCSCATEPGDLTAPQRGEGYILVGEKSNLDAEIYLDYLPTGKTVANGKIGPVKVGTHIVHLVMENFSSKPDFHTVELGEEGETVVFELTQTPFGHIDITTTPPGAMVTLDGLQRGRTPLDGQPLTLSGVPAGSHHIGFILGNYASSQTVDVQSGQAIPVEANPSLRRFVLVEDYSNTGCGPCPRAAFILDSAITAAGGPAVILIEYHADFPSKGDPMYEAAKTDHDLLQAYYKPGFLPNVHFNGAFIEHGADLDNKLVYAVDTLLAGVPTLKGNFNIIVTPTEGGAGTVTVEAAAEPANNLMLRISLMQEHVEYDTPPGSNGHSSFHHIYRGSYPNFTGTQISLPKGESGTWPFSFDTTPYGTETLYVIAYLQQDDETKQILQVNQARLQ